MGHIWLSWLLPLQTTNRSERRPSAPVLPQASGQACAGGNYAGVQQYLSDLGKRNAPAARMHLTLFEGLHLHEENFKNLKIWHHLLIAY